MIEPIGPRRRLNLYRKRPPDLRLRPERGEQRRNAGEAVVVLIAVLVGCWWLGSYIHHAVVAGSRNNPFVAVADSIARGVSGR